MSCTKVLSDLPLLPFGFHRLDSDSVVAVSVTGDHVFLSQSELVTLVHDTEQLSLTRRAELQSKFFIKGRTSKGMSELLRSRIAARKETVLSGPSLHILVPTLQCEHSCQYCQVSRSLSDTGYSMTTEQIDSACETIFQSPARTLTVEFQGGDPLLRFDLIERAIARITTINKTEQRQLRFVITSTLHQLTPDMCEYFRLNNVFLSTSLDGPAALHNRNRPIQAQNSYERTLAGIALARKLVGPDSVSALMTTTKASLDCPEDIVDEYVKHGFTEIFMRPLSMYGFAKQNMKRLGYSLDAFTVFYERAFERVLYWNRNGVELREATAGLILNKILSPFDSGYVDLQSPSGAGLATLVYNYDGYVYPSDEARMLAETGDVSLRLARIGEPITAILRSQVMQQLIESSLSTRMPGCVDCAFSPYCGPDPVGAQAEHGSLSHHPWGTEHCKRSTWLFDYFFRKLKAGDQEFLNLAYCWAQPMGDYDA
ncbi:His-Xaa-Ser system radical SAM maturase HxsB [Marinobacter sp.]|uniref:His-Xaa-Ser system radical SAM maturase HxsB n=1 Tax=Marinobacter sp. TaxID=50741 RepID=UPI003A954924